MGDGWITLVALAYSPSESRVRAEPASASLFLPKGPSLLVELSATG
jgi:hypothetical protein